LDGISALADAARHHQSHNSRERVEESVKSQNMAAAVRWIAIPIIPEALLSYRGAA
jgi:hypothetical protein